uniref:uncharacterized protein LOC108950895 isoform X20 n=1 Tax=Ciona intestinalis TaxID=7719 RepID=UPI000EF55280|nr:uncharacterized protein LOC108950895 isoform X20 [Ciona intestinalis]|eukprot:XP_026695983.1 uncharacterized protein LOC108950895 isoform X20 [Ciona intestinalis]
MEGVKSSADDESDDHQLNCYGLVFPENCDTYYGPHSVECLTTIWISKGCLSEGTKAPVKLDHAEKEVLDLLNVKEVLYNIQLVQMEADGGDKDRGLECYGIVYPENCNSYHGPHSIDCLIAIWDDVGCEHKGYRFPNNLTIPDCESMKNSNLTAIRDNIEGVKSAADDGNDDHQLNCYGLVFPENCDSYEGPHSVECFTTIWKSKGCLTEGTKAPVKLVKNETEALDLLNVDEIFITFETIRMQADGGNKDKGLECYGVVYLENCVSYHGPHSMDCLIAIWDDVGCEHKGYRFPNNLTIPDCESMKNSNLTAIRDNIEGVKSAADDGNDDHQLNCYGLVFPEHCDSYEGPHSVECFTTIWKSKGCLAEGTKSPVKLVKNETEALDLLNVDEIFITFETIRMHADGGNKDKGLECYGVVYPENCDSYHGSHSVECLVTIWEEVDCKVEGYRYPGNLTVEDVDALTSLNLTAVRENMEGVKFSADDGSDDHQLNCYGLIFPENCDTYYGPHSVECLTTIWISKGCLSEGTKAPVKLDHAEKEVLDLLNVKDVLDNLELVQLEADGGDKDRGLECYGIVYPENCYSYHGPHSMDCLIAIWDDVGCEHKGYRFPNNLTVPDCESMKNSNLTAIIKNMEDVKSAGDDGNDDHQLNCYGIVFPDNCDSYNGPHSVECFTTIWESKGCLAEGTKAPVKLVKNETEALDLLNVDEIFITFETIRMHADGGNKDKGLECYGVVYPENCDSYHGPHSIDCLIAIWDDVGCEHKGYRFPNNLTKPDCESMKNSNLTAIRDNMEGVKSAADDGNDDHQLNCYGIVFPDNCDSYEGPHSVECFTTIWEWKGCLAEGTKAPIKLVKNETEALDLLNVDEIFVNFETIRMHADGGNKDKGLECYGVVYPENCNSYHGPHSIECLVTIWEEVDCKVEGYRYPGNLTVEDADALKSLNLTAARENMEGVKSSADDGSDDHQLNCYGLVFPENCDTYYGPHSVECLTTIWISKGCLSEGTKAPVKLDHAEKEVLDLLSVKEVLYNIQLVQMKADGGDKDKGLECYGIVYPENCDSYHGPHSIDCLIAIWDDVGCEHKGYRFPNNLTIPDCESMKNSNLTAIRDNMEGVKSAADDGNDDHQLNCYGLVFPDNCDSYDGPHSVECLTTIWKSKGCLTEGTKAPVKLVKNETEALDLLNVDEIFITFETIRMQADGGNKDKGLECYGVVYPENCDSYHGPHSIECLVTIWEEVDCKVEGYRYPGNLTVADVDTLTSSNLTGARNNMERVKSSADDGSDDHQLNCYGLVFPENCDTYYGPHSVECLTTIWISKGCLSEGTKAPVKLDHAEKEVLDLLNVKEVLDNFELVQIEADGGDKERGLECYGIVYPVNCNSYYGPHSMDCLIAIWDDVGCEHKGYRFPNNLTIPDCESMKNSNLTAIRDNIEGVKSAADDGNDDHQLNCYGLVFPENCDSYNGPHSVECLTTIWKSKGCLTDGTKAPVKLVKNETEALDLLNVDEIFITFETIRMQADGGNKDKGLECYGVVYPETCNSYHGPHSMDCLIAIWDDVGCEHNGYRFPNNLTIPDCESMKNSNLTAIRDNMEGVKSAADDGNDDHQLNCYGLVFPDNCDSYEGPHSVECFTTIWKSKGCLTEGTKAPVKLVKNETEALDLLNVDEIFITFETIRMQAHGGDKDKGLECYGIVYPENCDSYHGPHSIECLVTIWEEVDCKVEGYRYPGNLTVADVDTLTSSNLTGARNNMERVKSSADDGSDDHQLNCYGLVFPDNCDTYYGPHSVQCLTTIWEWKGCLNEGTRAPVKLDHADKEAVDLLTVDGVLKNFELVQVEAHGGDKDKGLECYGIVYPENCNSYHGPHSIDCLIAIWDDVGCEHKGYRFPNNLTIPDCESMKNSNLTAIRDNIEGVKSAADDGSDDHQLNCYGLVFPEHCDSYEGPHSVECLTTIWESKGCLTEGTKAPVKLEKNETEALDLLTVDEIFINFETIRMHADGGNKDKGLECYGVVYPDNCTSYHGPHSIDCLITIWETVDCKVKGLHYPGNLTTADADALKSMNLTNVSENMESVKSAADGGNNNHQINCYGLAFPENCSTYYGPHSVECLTTIWKWKGCLGEGTKAPVKLITIEKDIINLLNVDEVLDNFETVRIEADGGDKDKGLECYGLVYPENCDSYHGPHSIECLVTIWEEVDCKVEGYRYPGNFSTAEADEWKSFNLRAVKENMESIKSAADEGNDDHQLNCYGIVFPENCDTYYGPYSIECLTTIWKSKGCLSEGTKAPVKLSVAEKDVFDLLDLKEVLDNFESVQVEAHGGDKDSGLECYGIVYPDNCTSYHGPHSIECLITIWEEVDCKVKGYRYPNNLTVSNADALKTLNLSAIRDNIESVKSAADDGNDDHQLNCYGIVFPDDCDTYHGPHIVECLTTIWKSKGCLSEGTKAPDKLDHAEKEALDLLNIHEVLDNFELVQVEAHGGDKDRGLECYGIVYPENCTSYHGPHSINCLITIWEEVDCKVKGYRYPGNLTTADADVLKSINLTAVRENMESVKLAADGGNDDHQLNCYGLVFPENCDSYYGLYTVECLSTMWEWKGCLGEGTKAPVELNTAERDFLDLLTVDKVLDTFELVQVEAHGGDKNKGLECYGIAFPDNCTSYHGPHSIDCLITIWEEVGCKVKGYRFPNNLTTAEAEDLKTLNLRDIMANMESVKSAADNGNDDHQLNCYGLVFPDNCDTYYGPHSVECLATIWEWKGCLGEGTKAPDKLNAGDNDALDLLNLHEVLDNFELVQVVADGGDKDKGLECYGIAFPDNCTSYHGPHSIDCLITIWKEVDCKVKGYRFPNNLTTAEAEDLKTLNLREIIANMEGVKLAADGGNDDHQLNCYGLVFPDNCDTYYGPHSVECLTTIWEWKGCLVEGTKAPDNLNAGDNDALDLLNLHEVLDNFELVQVEADGGDKDKGLECYGIAFPDNCTSYHGPHSIECLLTIWEEVDCKVEGYRYPNNLTTADAEDMVSFNLRDIKANMGGVKKAADNGNDIHQLNCYGLVFPDNCDTYYSPHSVECLTTIWELKGCLSEGTKAPVKLDHGENEALDLLNINEVLDYFELVRMEADGGDKDKGLECYGIAFPDNCTSYHGPHFIDCLITIWKDVGCKEKGYRFPNNLTIADCEVLKHSTLRAVRENMEGVKLAADGGNDDHQLNCYGSVFPDNCDTYYGPHSAECLTTIWEWKGCLSEGTKAPIKLDHADKEAVDLLTVDEVLDNFELVQVEAHGGDKDKGLECYGIVYPDNCTSYLGPHSIECLLTIWEEVDCKVEGYRYPNNLTTADAEDMVSFNLRDVRGNMEGVKSAADNGNDIHQLNCYGLVFPDNCDTYYGPHSVECLTTIWESKGCLSEGTKAPDKLDHEENQAWDLLNINEVLGYFELVRMEADGGDKDRGLECYGIVFPDNCTSYHGPHFIDCLITIWKDVGCKEKGYRFPNNLTIADCEVLKYSTLRAVRENMEGVKLAADGGNDDHQLNCYGLVFPDNCDTYYGPHSVQCLTTIWEWKGCLGEGTRAPVNLDHADKEAVDLLTVDEVLDNFELVQVEADGGDKDKGLECYGIVYPENCDSYYGPHSIECLITIWEEVDCMAEGYRYPNNLTIIDTHVLEFMNLRSIRENMESVKSAADDGNDDHQLNCYGIVFPDNCDTYYGPQSVECLTTIWTIKGCLSEGTKAPTKLDHIELHEVDVINISGILQKFEAIPIEANGGDDGSQLECYGLVFPEHCDSYHGQHSVECLITIWEEVDCKVEGYRYPNNLTIENDHSLEFLNLRDVRANMEGVKSAADNGNDDHQLNCYGLGKNFNLSLIMKCSIMSLCLY